MTIKQQFKSAIKRGTGEAYLLLKAHPEIDFSNDIIKASLKNLSYDNQSEGSRANYVFELIQLSCKKEKIRKAIIKALASERKDTWALIQLFDLTALFAKQGDQEARKSLYKRFNKKTIRYAEWAGDDALIDLDGLDGLKYIAEVKGKAIQKNPEAYDDSWVVDSFQIQNPTIKVYQELQKASKNNEYIKTYLDSIKKHKIGSQKRKRSKYNYKVVTERINSASNVPLPPAGAKDLSKTDVKKLANDFLRQTDRNTLEKYMRVFERVKFPYDYQPLLKFAKGRNAKNDRLVEFAVGALKYFAGTDIRDFAIERMKKIKIPYDYLDLLVSNYKKGDGKLLTEIVGRSNNEHDIHSLVDGYINIYKANNTRECKKPLEALYEKLTCGIHRADIIKILIENKVLSAKIKREIEFDSYNEILKML